MTGKFSGITLSYCSVFTTAKIAFSGLVSSFGVSFELDLCSRKRFVFLRLSQNTYAVLIKPKIILIIPYFRVKPWHKVAEVLQGLLKESFLSVAGYAIAFKKRFYLSGQVNRLKKMRKTRLTLQLGFSHKIRIRSLKIIKFRRWRRKKFGLLLKANSSNKFAAFIDFFRHLRLRGQYTNRGVRLRNDRFKMKFRPDHGKYGFKMNYS